METSKKVKMCRLPFAFTIVCLLATFMILPSELNARVFTDDLGRKVDIPTPPRRIVSLAPNITEILFHLNLGDRIAGITDFCDYPQETAGKPRVGWLISPNVEKIISLKPDIVFATAEGNRADIVALLERINIKVYVLNPHTLEDILREILSIGEVTGQDELSRERVEGLTMRVDAVKKNVINVPPVKVLYLVSLEPMISVGPGSFIHDIIEIAGGENIISDSPVRYPRIEMEEVILRDPDVIMAPPDLVKAIRSWKKRWGEISAIKQERIYSIDPDIISRPGPRIVDGLEHMYRHLHENK